MSHRQHRLQKLNLKKAKKECRDEQAEAGLRPTAKAYQYERQVNRQVKKAVNMRVTELLVGNAELLYREELKRRKAILKAEELFQRELAEALATNCVTVPQDAP
jgi:hypothetical protein